MIHTQAALDAAIAKNPNDWHKVGTTSGKWLDARAGAKIIARRSSWVRAGECSHIVARRSSWVEAHAGSLVTAYDGSRVLEDPRYA